MVPNYLKTDKQLELLITDFDKALTKCGIDSFLWDLSYKCNKGDVSFEISLQVTNCVMLYYISGNEDEYKSCIADLSTEMQITFEYNEVPPLPPPLVRNNYEIPIRESFIDIVEEHGLEYFIRTCIPIDQMRTYLNNPLYLDAQYKYLNRYPEIR